MGAAAAPHALPNEQKKKLIRRFRKDRSQVIRHVIQGAFVLLNAWLGVQLYIWVRYFERGGVGWQVSRPRRSGGLAAHRRPHELEVFLVDWPDSRGSSRRDVFIWRIFAHEPAAQESLLLLRCARSGP